MIRRSLWLVAVGLVFIQAMSLMATARKDPLSLLEGNKAATGTKSPTVTALSNIKSMYGFNLSWVNDPCIPTPWKGVMCSGTSVVSLNLSNMNLNGDIAPAFGDLIDLQTLDLHNNSLMTGMKDLVPLIDLQMLDLSFNLLQGVIPDLTGMNSLQTLDLQSNKLSGTLPVSLGSLPALKDLNVENNTLSGPIPESLNKSSLTLRTSGNPCIDISCNPPGPPVPPPPPEPILSSSPPLTAPSEKSYTTAIVGGSVGGVAVLVIIGGLLFCLYRRQRKEMQPVPSRRNNENLSAWNGVKRFSLKEVKKGTSNFKEPIGHGSFGPVYSGRLANGQRVAVKVRTDASQIGHDSFVNEVFLLSQVHHQNLVSLIGFCLEAKQQILIYEYLAGGTFTDHLYGDKAKRKRLVWKKRLQIAVGAATGLEYLHSHNPRIIHRDVKSNNILLDADLTAKVSDFGLSKHLEKDDATHVTTAVKGTAGYLDPEYYATQQLTEKSDVYSFGVVLLEIICGREPLSQEVPPDQYNLVFWAKPFLETGSFHSVVDKSLENTYSTRSMEIVIKLAARCIDRVASSRPSMWELLEELKAALAIEVETTGRDSSIGPDSVVNTAI